MRSRSAFLLAALIVGAGPLDAQTRRTVRLTVRTLDATTGAPVGDVLIRLSGLEDSHTTAADGTLSFDAPLGSYRLTARRPGYETLRGDFLVRRSGAFTLAMESIAEGDPSVSGRVTGVLVDVASDRPLVGAVVELRGYGEQMTDQRGRFTFDGVPRGPASLDIRMMGYEDRTESVSVEQGVSSILRVALSVEPIELPPIEVEVRSRVLEDRGVYRRMEGGVATQYVTRQELEQKVTQHLGEAFATTPGVRLQRTGHRSILVGRDNCPLDVFMDGIPVMAEEADGLYNMDMFPPEWVEIAEVYASAATVPIEFARSGSGCGVVLIWTRQRQ